MGEVLSSPCMKGKNMARQSLKNVARLIEEAKKQSPIEQSFIQDLKRSIEMTNKKTKRTPSRTYKPSSMNCMRQSYYQITGVKADDEADNYNLIAICETGTDRHERIQNAVAAMKDNKMDCEYIDVGEFVKSRNLDYLTIVCKEDNETKLYHKTLNISFKCDGIVKYHDHYYIVEFKTEGSSKFFSRQGVDPKHYNQAITYSLALDLPEVLFVYISRDTLDMKCYLYTVTDEMKNGILSYIEECDGYVKRQITPPRPADIERKTCMYCSYASQCKKE